jgi:hypothetical protein
VTGPAFLLLSICLHLCMYSHLICMSFWLSGKTRNH